ncbi:uncharacterized protein LAESUDRAFT_728227 [Laetiporus sulphureus 93-53]|uniref:Uncharacterized protein n=1 Tax=Laetiporus sulphureus 93-53 TaxID=1314785 RepID=A0A165D9F4_9APHY|nr:uncharacterized protein LAESUDRAFT_728227 [Laetiporus sulphureus 93-53]KZT04379.1 hypothetical protein LAESUDRAFT_728227 [Laetiporus sulphureus 93-53]
MDSFYKQQKQAKAGKASVRAQKMTGRQDKPLPSLPSEAIPEVVIEVEGDSTVFDNGESAYWVKTGGPLLGAFQSSVNGTPTASAAGSTTSLLLEQHKTVLAYEWASALTPGLLDKRMRTASLVSHMSSSVQSLGLIVSADDRRTTEGHSAESSLFVSEMNLHCNVDTVSDADDGSKAPICEPLETRTMCCAKEDKQRCLSYSYRRKGGFGTRFGYHILAGAIIDVQAAVDA